MKKIGIGLFLVVAVLVFALSAASKEEISPEAKTAIDNSINLLSKIMEKAILQSTNKALELIPQVGQKSEKELDEIMDKEVREVTLKVLKDEKFADAVIEAVKKSAQDAFKKAVEEAMKQSTEGKK
ncbi:MAG: hypothetical protein HQM08_23720 [Candidatus Riflebacteria bacterium]|nr:hypothetical protein [Candidatus Riflebacteria bacterium]